MYTGGFPQSNGIFKKGQVAQLVERSPEKAGVGGSIPSLATTFSNIYKPTSPYYWQLYDALTALT